jgi:hypothetical protein
MGWWSYDDGVTVGDDSCLAIGTRLASARDAWRVEKSSFPSLISWLAAARDALRALSDSICSDGFDANGEIVAEIAHPARNATETTSTAGIAADPDLTGALSMAFDAAAFAYEESLERKPTKRELLATLQIELGRLEDYVDVDEPFDLVRLVPVEPT